MMCVEDHGEEFVWHTSTLSPKNMRSLAWAVTRVVAMLCFMPRSGYAGIM